MLFVQQRILCAVEAFFCVAKAFFMKQLFFILLSFHFTMCKYYEWENKRRYDSVRENFVVLFFQVFLLSRRKLIETKTLCKLLRKFFRAFRAQTKLSQIISSCCSYFLGCSYFMSGLILDAAGGATEKVSVSFICNKSPAEIMFSLLFCGARSASRIREVEWEFP